MSRFAALATVASAFLLLGACGKPSMEGQNVTWMKQGSTLEKNTTPPGGATANIETATFALG